MSKWPMLAVFAIVLQPGCAPSVQAGLANAPRLGGNGDERVHDVISSGADSCGRYAESGPLRYRIPPCPVVMHPVAGVALPAPVNGSKTEDELVVPWLQHFYVGWPCQTPAIPVSDKTVACSWRP